MTAAKKPRFSVLRFPWARTWLVTVPVHLLAFVALFMASARVVERELQLVAGEAGRDRLEGFSREIDELAAEAPASDADMGHLLRRLIASQEDISLQLFVTPDTSVGPPRETPAEVRRRLATFFTGDAEQQMWLSSEGGRRFVRGLRRISTGPRCVPCHEPKETMAVVTMALDITPMAHRLRSHSRRNLGLLILVWGLLLGATNILVGRSVQRFGKRLEAQLAAAEDGQPALVDSPELVLDPISPQLGRALQGFLERQRHRQAEVASRLEHSDQLASLGRLAAGLAHEIKNPLAGIQGALEILREDDPGQRNLQLYNAMLDELERVNTTLQLLLESARPSAPKLARADPGELVENTVHLLRPGFKRQGVALDYEIAPGLGKVTMDATKIRQVLVNLVQNAADAMEGDGHIMIRAARLPEAEEGLILAVEDDGPGLPAEVKSRIFEPFFTTKFGGTGLGLAIARRLVEQHGGSLEVDSEPGRGATFYVLLPPVSSQAVTEDLGAQPAE